MEHINKIPYREVNFFYIKDHYDIHIEGLCIFNNKICYFKTDMSLMYDLWNEEDDSDWDVVPTVDIFKLTDEELIRELHRKTMFELSVGYHWSYPHRRVGHKFHYRKPKWLYGILFRLFYFLNKKQYL